MCTATLGVHYALRTRSRLGIDFKVVAVVDYMYPRRTWIISDCIRLARLLYSQLLHKVSIDMT